MYNYAEQTALLPELVNRLQRAMADRDWKAAAYLIADIKSRMDVLQTWLNIKDFE